MSGKLSEVESRIGTVHQLEAVITAMRGSAAARSREARSRLDGIRAYAAVIGEAIGQALALAPGSDPPPRKPQSPERHVVIVLSSEQGFAGAFNERVLDAAERHLKVNESELLIIGDRGAMVAAERGLVFDWSAPMVAHAQEVPLLASRITDALYVRLEKDQARRMTVIHAVPAPSIAGACRLVSGEGAGNPVIWEARLRTAAELEREADRLEEASEPPRRTESNSE
jgi:F-type H+-transporting ATPase subunit gamma